jgi:predicted dehydrogenase
MENSNVASGALPRPRIGIVGCGTVGGVHRDRLLAEAVDIVAVCDPDADALSRMAASLPRRPKLFRSEQDLIAAAVVDAVVLCTPHARHALQIRTALDAGVHVLCEKPFVTDPDVAAELVAQARDKSLALFVAYTRRSRGHARFLIDAAAQIGPLQNVLITRAQPWFQRHKRTWRMHETEGGGFLLDAGASMLDLLLHFIDQPVDEIDAVLYRPAGADLDVDTQSSIRFRFAGGARAELMLIGDATEQVERIQIFGERGSAGWLLRQDAPHDLYLRRADPDSSPGAGVTEIGDPGPFRTLSPDAAFLRALRSDDIADRCGGLYDAATAVPVVALVDRIYRQAVWG